MKLFTNVLKPFRRNSGKKLVVTAATLLMVASAGVTGLVSLNNGKAQAGDCSGNSIIMCGEPNRASFINKVRSSSELQAVYASFGLHASDYNRFVTSAQSGVAYDNNTIVVGGRVVATNVGSIGRYRNYQGANPRSFTIAGHQYWGNLDSRAFANGTHAIPVDVLFNAQGKVQFAVMTGSCGNPTYQTPTTPTYACKNLNLRKAAGTQNTYYFSTNASAGNGASISKLVYNFGDGSQTVTTTSPSKVVKHTFTKSANVSVTVYVKVPGGGTVKLGGGDCVKHITFVPPAAVYACELLTLTPGKMNSDNTQTYTLNAKASAKNATIVGYTFYYGDGQGPKVVKTSANSFSVVHNYAPGTHTAQVKLTVRTNTGKVVNGITSANCEKSLTVKPLVSNLACVNLTLTNGSVAANGSTAYTLNATASKSNATITSYVFDFGDNHSQTVTSGNTTASATHAYAVGDFTAHVTVHGTDANGKAIASSSYNCTKPVHVPPVASNLACVNLTLTKGSVNQNTGATVYTLNAAASKNNATITSYVFNFGDNHSQTVTTGATTANSSAHTYAAGDFTASVTVKGHDANGQPISVSAPACSKPVHVSTPECKPGVPMGSPQCSNLACVSLSLVPGTKNDDSSQAYALNATASTDNATITSYVFNFGDNSQPMTVSSGATTASTNHTYAPGNYTASVTVNGHDSSNRPISATAPACNKPVTVTPPQPHTPGITITKTVDGEKQEQVDVGQNFVYQLVITNTGDQDLTNAVVTDPAPQGVTMLSADLGTVADNSFSYTIPTLAAGQSVTVNITAVVNAFVPDNMVNTACVNAPEVNPSQPTQPDSCDTATVSVTPPEVLVNTGAGSVLGLFGASAVIGTLGYRLILSRRLGRQ